MNIRTAARMAKIEEHPQISDALVSEHIRKIQRRLDATLPQLSQSDGTLLLFTQNRAFHYATLAPIDSTNFEVASDELLESLAYGYELTPALRDELDGLPKTPESDIRNPAAWLLRRLAGLPDWANREQLERAAIWKEVCDQLRRASEIIEEGAEK